MSTLDAPQSPDGGAPRATLDRNFTSVARYVIAGIATILALIVGIGGWAATTDLAGAVIASGTVVVSGNVKKVQHPTGGVVSRIFVKNGDHVKAGDLLVRLDDTVTRANLEVIRKQIDEQLGRLSRLKAERDDAPRVIFPDQLKSRAFDPSVADIVAGEQTLFEARTRSRNEQKKQLGERIRGLQEEIAGNTAQAAAKSQEIELIGKELASLLTLEERQLVTTSKMMALRREAARLEGEKAQLQAAAGRSRGQIAEIEVQKLNIDSQAKSEVVKDLREVEARLGELSERRIAAEDQLKRIDVLSPVDGLVHQMSIFTVGGVVTTSEPLMLIVPEGDDLVIEAKISPRDIDQARTHRMASVRFPAFNMRTTPNIDGDVVQIAADLSHETQQPNISYYLARIKISDEQLKRLGSLRLVPGMPAEVQITTDARTALSYLLKPVTDQFAKAFKER